MNLDVGSFQLQSTCLPRHPMQVLVLVAHVQVGNQVPQVKKKVEKKRAENELREEVRISAEKESMDTELVVEKRPRVVGPLNTVVASGKWKQTSINEAEKRKYKELAHDHCAMWAYAKGIPFNAFDDEEFDLFASVLVNMDLGTRDRASTSLECLF